MSRTRPFAPDVLESLDSGRVERARALVGQGAIRSLHHTDLDDLVLLAGCVADTGSEWRSHAVVDRARISGDCSCPAGRDCEHVAALALAAIEGRRASSESARQGPHPESTRTADRPVASASDGADEHRMIYLLGLSEDGSQLSVCPSLLAPGRDGRSAVATPFALSRLSDRHQPDYIQASDLAILHELSDRTLQATDRVWCPLGSGSQYLLRAMLATGRCHWQSARNPALALGEPLPARLDWVLLPSGDQRLEMVAAPDADDDLDDAGITLPMLPPWRLDPQRGLCRPLSAPGDNDLIAEMLAMGPVAPDAVADVRQRLQPEPESVPLPRVLKLTRLPPDRPQPRLRLQMVELFEGSRPVRVAAARLSFGYGEIDLPWGSESTSRLLGSDRVVVAERDTGFEEACIDALAQRRLVTLQTIDGYDHGPGEDGLWVARQAGRSGEMWLELQQHFERLRRDGWAIAVAEDFAPLLVTPEDWFGELLADADASDAFDLDFGVAWRGRRWSLLPALLDWLEAAPESVLRLLLSGQPPDGRIALALDEQRVVLMPMPRLAAALRALSDSSGSRPVLFSGRLRLPRSRLAELADTGREWRYDGDPALTEVARRLADFERIEPQREPEGLKAELRDYQRFGLGWLKFLSELGFGGILADDMGLGKTLQALAHVVAEKRAGRLERPCLVVAPTSLMFNWRAEAHRFAPDLRVLLLHGPERKGRFQWIGQSDLVLTTYALLARDAEWLGRERFDLLILDEAQAIKNPRAKAGVAARSIDARQRLCLTGTPLENHVGDLWSLFDVLMPGLLGSRSAFRRRFQNPIERHDDGERRDALARRIQPFFLRRTKAEVAPELPPKTEMLRVVSLEASQRRLYERVRVAMHDKLRRALARQGSERSQVLVFDALLRLRQICCHPSLAATIDGVDHVPSAKLELLMQLVPELIEEGRRVLLFSQFVGMLDLIEREIRERGLAFTRLDGRTRDRQGAVERFQTGRVPLFLISLKAGGVGLNLTAADTVIHYDPWWNPAVEDQATDRAHRIGQEQKVFVYRLLTENTVEQRVFDLQQSKRGLLEGVLGGGGASTLTPDMIDELFRPID
ncbi:MAG: DEAD/DEAH box helicase [Wenzhouxiangella sp.]|nr:DEAD/DEAH box helicase [Wenzhouxiangella sp.]